MRLCGQYDCAGGNGRAQKKQMEGHSQYRADKAVHIGKCAPVGAWIVTGQT